jgi:hypothetical protein
MDSNTFYYTLSTIPQVLAALVALVAVFVQFRLQLLRDHLIGHGKSVLNRSENPNYGLQGQKDRNMQLARLRDSIDRRSIQDIKRVIERFAEHEETEGHTTVDLPTGFQYLRDRYAKTVSLVASLRTWTVATIGASFLTILVSIIGLMFADSIIGAGSGFAILCVDGVLAIGTLIPIGILIYLGLSESREEQWDNE